MVFVYIPHQAVFQICIAYLARVEIPQNALNFIGRQNLTDNVEYRIAVECIADFLQLLKQPLENVSLDGVGCDKVKNQAVLRLEVTMDSPHPLLQAIWIPWNVVVEQDMAALQVDAFPCRFGRN